MTRPICGACRGSGLGATPHQKCRACRGSGEGYPVCRPGHDYCDRCEEETPYDDLDGDLVCVGCREKEREGKEARRDAEREA